MATDILLELTAMFEKAGPVHHQAYIETDGEDADWPLWYADYLYDDLKKLTGFLFTKSELVWFLVEADRRYRTKSSQQHWAESYAEIFLHEFGN